MTQPELEKLAAELLEKCETVALASVAEDGSPRICPMMKLKGEDFSTIWVSTGTGSRKTAHFRNDPKAGLSYWNDDDSVTMTGTVEIVDDAAVKRALWSDWMQAFFPKGVDDPEYCVLKFTAREATFWLQGAFETYRY